MAFSNKILLLKDGKLEKLDSPENIYNTLDNVYQAGFFGEVSIVPSGILSNDELILLPSQLQLSEIETDFKVLVEKNYFKGNYYLVQAKFGNHIIFFENKNPFKLNTEVCLQLRNQ